jgi:hypothetical protein
MILVTLTIVTPDLGDMLRSSSAALAKFERGRVMTNHRELIVVLESGKETSDVPAYEWLYRMCGMSK